MRVIAGKARGHKLKSLEGLETRPTLDRVKESLFNMLQSYLYDCIFLDLFSGTGSIGIEALSRGVDRTFFVDKNPQAVATIQENLKHTKLIDQAEVLCLDAFEALDELRLRKIKFNVIYLDPPFFEGYNVSILKKIKETQILHSDGILVLERATENVLNEEVGYSIIKEKKYGKITLSFLKEECLM